MNVQRMKKDWVERLGYWYLSLLKNLNIIFVINLISVIFFLIIDVSFVVLTNFV